MFTKNNGEFLDNLLAAIVICVVLAIVYLIQAWIGMWLWNDIVGLPWVREGGIRFWEMYGLIWLAHLIFPSHNSSSNS